MHFIQARTIGFGLKVHRSTHGFKHHQSLTHRRDNLGCLALIHHLNQTIDLRQGFNIGLIEDQVDGKSFLALIQGKRESIFLLRNGFHNIRFTHAHIDWLLARQLYLHTVDTLRYMEVITTLRRGYRLDGFGIHSPFRPETHLGTYHNRISLLNDTSDGQKRIDLIRSQ